MKQNQMLTDAVKKYIGGKESAFTTIYEESYRYLHTCVIHIVKDEDLAQDMLQNTYLEIIKNISQLKEPENFLGWAATIANRKCIADIKKRKDVLLSEQTDEEGNEQDYFESVADDEALIPENVFDDKAKVDIIRGIIDDLSDVQRACVIGFYYNEMKQEEIAEELGIPVNTVKSHLNRAKAKIKDSVCTTEKDQGIKLFAFIPFFLLFFNTEAKACELAPMSDELFSAFKTPVKVNAAKVGKAINTAKEGSKIAAWKIGTAIVAGIVVIGGIAAVVSTKNADSVVSAVEEIESESLSEDANNEKEDNSQVDLTEEIADTQTGEDINLDRNEIKTDIAVFTKIALSESGYRVYSSKEGVAIIYSEEDEIGLATYDGEILLEPKQRKVLGDFTDDGMILFEEEGGKQIIYDSHGNVAYTSENSIMAYNEGVVLEVENYENYPGYDGYACRIKYLNLNGSVLHEAQAAPFNWDHGANGMSEGYAFLTNGETDFLEKVSVNGEVSRVRPLEWVVDSSTNDDGYITRDGITYKWISHTAGASFWLYYPIGSMSEGISTYAGGQAYEDICDHYQLLDENGNEVGEYNIADLLESFGYPVAEKTGEYRVITDYDFGWNLSGFYKGCTICYNYGTKAAITLNKGDFRRTVLIDAASNRNLFDADSISISEEKYWLYSDEGKWGYIDHDGNIQATYEDATKFPNGLAMVIKDGKAFLIDEELRQYETGIDATSVISAGELFEIHNGDEISIFSIK